MCWILKKTQIGISEFMSGAIPEGAHFLTFLWMSDETMITAKIS